MSNFTRYANLTDEQRDSIIQKFRQARAMGATAGHATACAALDAFELTDRQWNSKIGKDAYAASLATLYMSDELEVEYAHPSETA